MKDRGLEKKDEPTLLIVDTQAVKNTDSSSKEIKGFCIYKCTNGIKRSLIVDTLGIPKFIKCLPANKSDDHIFIETIRDNSSYFLNLNYQMTIMADNGYHKDKLEEELIKINPLLKDKIAIQITPKPTKDPDNKGFKPAHKVEKWRSGSPRLEPRHDKMGCRKIKCLDG